ncbi:MAG: c-type cytochrome, partial [Sphingomonas sp.]
KESTPAQLAYIVQHGVKYSGMPAWPAQSRPDEVWPVVAFLRAMPRLGYAKFDALANGGAGSGLTKAGIAPFAPPEKLRPFSLYAPIQNSNSETVYIEPTYGFDSQASVRDPIANCARCHGADGRGRPGGRFPNLTLQTPTYLYDALMSFAHGTRKSAYMQVVATQLSDAQLASLARYYGAMAAAASPQATPDAAMKAEGAHVAAYGIGQKGVGGCTNCHGAEGSARGIPRLEGQSYYYLVDQMRAFRAGGRGVTHGVNPMRAIAHNLNDHQIAAVSAFYAATPPTAKPVEAARQAAAR